MLRHHVSRPDTSSASRALAVTVLGLLLLGQNCAMTRIVPVQIARIVQQELYEQRFEFNVPEERDASTSFVDRSRVMENVFLAFLGPKNWQTITELYGAIDFRDEVLNGGIYIRGQLTLLISPDPLNRHQFLLEGQGRYFVLREQSHEILISGDFHVVPRHHLLGELDEGSLEIEVRLFTARIPRATTYYHESSVSYRIFLDTRFADRGVFSIDYDREHQALINGVSFGAVRFDHVLSTDKLFDLRGLRFLRDDYLTMIEARTHDQVGVDR